MADVEIDEVLEAWRTNQRVDLMLVEAIDDEGLACTLSTRGGRTVARQLGHLHDVRIMHLEARAKPLAKGARKFPTKAQPTRKELVAALEDSAARVEEWLRGASEGRKGVRTFKKGLVTTLAYLVAHEAHHRGNILLTLKQCGRALPQEVRWGIWDWDRI